MRKVVLVVLMGAACAFGSVTATRAGDVTASLGAEALAPEELANSRAQGRDDGPNYNFYYSADGRVEGSIGSSVTGGNSINLPNFAGNGIFTFVQNSGNQAVIQTGVVVGITVH
ncbi:MAG TPA: hypothetical protein VF342_05085 [Alphaproteobacteria bacterium]